MAMKTQIKNELHQLIDNCENEVLLTEADLCDSSDKAHF